MSVSLTNSVFDRERIDFRRMREERHRRLVSQMEAQDVDALILSSRPNVNCATGVVSPLVDSSREYYHPIYVAVTRDGAAPHVFTPYREGVPESLPEANRHEPFLPEFEDGVRQMAEALKSALGPALNGRVGIDDFTPASYALLPELLPQASLVDATPVMAAARVCKTRDEVECIKRAQALNEHAMYDAQAALRPGVRQTDLTGVFLKRLTELGATGNHIDPIWTTMPTSKSELPRGLHGVLPYPLPTTDQILREGDVLWVDAGIEFMGYNSDFGRTWVCGLDPRPSDRVTDQFKRWRDVFLAVRETARPGKSGTDITEAAMKAAGGIKPWLDQFYVVHGMGLDSAEAPLIGTDLGPAFDASIELQPGMVLVCEPAFFEEGVGGYRSEDILVVTDGEPELITHYPYTPWEGRP